MELSEKMNFLAARKTEYRGVVFASKAEARFALFLDSQKEHWWYEPRCLKLAGGYVPDFMLIRMYKGCEEGSCFNEEGDFSNFYFNLKVIEYKPKRPTKTYIEELTQRYKSIRDRLHSEKTLEMLLGGVVNATFCVMTGGMGYDKSEWLPIFWHGPDHKSTIGHWQKGWGHVFEDVNPDDENERLSKFRFDLQTS